MSSDKSPGISTQVSKSEPSALKSMAPMTTKCNKTKTTMLMKMSFINIDPWE